MGSFHGPMVYMENKQDKNPLQCAGEIPQAGIWVKSYGHIGKEEGIVWFPYAQEKSKQTGLNDLRELEDE